MIRIEYSSMCLNELNYRDKINQAQAFVQAQGFEFGIQIHNSIDKSLYDKLIEFKGAIPFSVHSPVFSRYFLNLASTDFSIIQECSDTCIRYLNDLNTDLFFFHGFFMTEKPIVHDMKNYRRTIREGIGDSYCLNGSFIMEPTFFNTDTFQKYKTIFQKNFTNFKQRYSDFTIALENDFPVSVADCKDLPKSTSLLIISGLIWGISGQHHFFMNLTFMMKLLNCLKPKMSLVFTLTTIW